MFESYDVKMFDWVLTKLITRERSWSWSPSKVAEKFTTVVLMQTSEGSLGSGCRHTRNNLEHISTVKSSNSNELNIVFRQNEMEIGIKQPVKFEDEKHFCGIRQLALACSKRAPHLKEELYSISVFPTLSNS